MPRKIWISKIPNTKGLVIFNKCIPFRGYFAIDILGIIFVREKFRPWFEDDAPEDRKEFVAQCLRHEAIHTRQMLELGIIFFYIFYLVAWIIGLFSSRETAYRDICFEQEAFDHQNDLDYLKVRKPYAWFKYLSKASKK